jgi:hypothetical protein
MKSLDKKAHNMCFAGSYALCRRPASDETQSKSIGLSKLVVNVHSKAPFRLSAFTLSISLLYLKVNYRVKNSLFDRTYDLFKWPTRVVYGCIR